MSANQYDYRKTSTSETLASDIEALMKTNKAEKLFILESLEEFLTDLAEASVDFNLSHLIFPSSHESSLQLSQRAGQSRLNELLQSEEFLSLEELSHIPDTATYVCDANKNMQVIVDDMPMHIDDVLKENETLNQHLDDVCAYASKAGGFIYSSDEINIEQWLRFYGHPIPSSATQLASLVSFIKKEHDKLSTTQNYWALLKNPDTHPAALTLAQREKIQTVTQTFGANDTGQLLSVLLERAISAPVDDTRIDPLKYVNNLMASTIGKHWAEGYLRALEWYGTESDEPAFAEDLQQLLMAAIVLNIDPAKGEVECSGRVLDYGLYKPANAECHPAQVMRSLEKHLVDTHKIKASAAPLAAYMLTADVAPELLVKDIPAAMTIGSPAWVAHSVTVAKIETIAPGASLSMTYEQIESYAELEPFDEQLEQLFALIVIAPLLNWGAMNGLFAYNLDGEYTVDNFQASETQYSQYTEALEQCSDAFNTPLPTREEEALKELKRAMPDGAYLTNKNYLHTDHAMGQLISIHELFTSGDLINEGWVGNTLSRHIYTSFESNELDQAIPYLSRLQNVHELYKETFDNYFKQLQRGTSTALKLALSKMPEKDRIRLEYGVLSFYTVRKKFSDHIATETQADRDKHRGRYGVIICANYDSTPYYYELFTLRAECRSRQDLKRVFERTPIEYFDPSEDSDKNQEQWQTQAIDWPLDIDAYLNGTAPVNNVVNKLVVEKLWESYEDELDPPFFRTQLDTFFSQRTTDIVDILLKFFPPAKYEELYEVGYGVTPLEAARKNREQHVELVLNLIIPFKSCIEDLASGDPDRKASGVFGCALDAVAMVGAVVGVASKFASVALKSGSLLSRSVKLIRVSGNFALSLVNPLDGVPSLLKKGGTLTKNGVLLITGQGIKSSSRATRQVRSIGGTLDAFNAAKSLNCADVKIANWESIGELSQATDVFIAKRGNDWYQLELNPCQTRGGKLTSEQVA